MIKIKKDALCYIGCLKKNALGIDEIITIIHMVDLKAPAEFFCCFSCRE